MVSCIFFSFDDLILSLFWVCKGRLFCVFLTDIIRDTRWDTFSPTCAQNLTGGRLYHIAHGTKNENTRKKLKKQRGSFRYQTSLALCNPTDGPHRVRTEIFIIRFALSWHTECQPFAANATATLQRPAVAKIASVFEWPGQPPKISPSLWGSVPPSNTWFPRPTRVFFQNGMSIGSAGFAQL